MDSIGRFFAYINNLLLFFYCKSPEYIFGETEDWQDWLEDW